MYLLFTLQKTHNTSSNLEQCVELQNTMKFPQMQNTWTSQNRQRASTRGKHTSQIPSGEIWGQARCKRWLLWDHVSVVQDGYFLPQVCGHVLMHIYAEGYSFLKDILCVQNCSKQSKERLPNMCTAAAQLSHSILLSGDLYSLLLVISYD